MGLLCLQSLSLQVLPKDLLTLSEGSTTHARLIHHVETNLKNIKFTAPLLHIRRQENSFIRIKLTDMYICFINLKTNS